MKIMLKGATRPLELCFMHKKYAYMYINGIV
jgi:hypothetical protein